MPDTRERLVRLRLASDIQRATIFRIEPRRTADFKEAHAPRYVAGQKVLEETIRPIPAELITEFASWLRFKDNFSDHIAQRCVDEQRVFGLLLVTNTQGVERDTEVVIDFACGVMSVVAMEGRGKIWTQMYFHPSRAALLSILRRALPNDSELKALQ
jgi:hypothetical protein